MSLYLRAGLALSSCSSWYKDAHGYGSDKQVELDNGWGYNCTIATIDSTFNYAKVGYERSCFPNREIITLMNLGKISGLYKRDQEGKKIVFLSSLKPLIF